MPRYNIAPTQMSPIVVAEGKGRELHLARWGLVPSWSRDLSLGASDEEVGIVTLCGGQGCCSRKPYPSDVSDDAWPLVVPSLTLMRADAAQREHSLRELFNGLRYVVRYGIAWRAMPHDLPPWFTVYQQTQRWLAAGCAFDPRKRSARWLRRSQAQAWLETAYGRRYAGSFAGAACHTRQCR